MRRRGHPPLLLLLLGGGGVQGGGGVRSGGGSEAVGVRRLPELRAATSIAVRHYTLLAIVYDDRYFEDVCVIRHKLKMKSLEGAVDEE